MKRSLLAHYANANLNKQSDRLFVSQSYMEGTHMKRLIESIYQQLLPGLRFESLNPYNPVVVHQVPPRGSYSERETTLPYSTTLAIRTKW